MALGAQEREDEVREYIEELREWAAVSRRHYGAHSSRAAELDELALRFEGGLEKLERELEEAREVHEHERNNLIQTAQAHQRAHRAAEARLAAVAKELDVSDWNVAALRRRIRAALSAPAEPKEETCRLKP